MKLTRPLRVFVAGIDMFYSRETLRGIQEYSKSHGGWQFYMGGNVFDRISFSPFSQGQSAWMPDGMLVSARSPEAVDVARGSGLPVVNYSVMSMNSGLPTVVSDNVAIGRLGARHLIERGLRSFGASHCTPGAPQLRTDGFVRELAKWGYECNVRHIKPDDRELERKDLADWLAGLVKPVGVMAYQDDLALDVLWACQLLGLRIPEDVAILGVGNFDHAGSLWTPGISSIELGLHRLGFRAAELLHRLIQGKAAPAKPILIPPLDVVTRESTDIVATDDKEVAHAMRIIRDHAQRPLSVKEILAEIPISRRSFERRFFKVVGRSPRAEITRGHLEMAKRLLRETQMSIPLVGENSGFSNRMVFATFFRRKTGMTPSEYRRTVRVGRNPPDRESSPKKRSVASRRA